MDYLSGRTALHFAAVGGHVRCIRLVVADFVPSVPYGAVCDEPDSERADDANSRNKSYQRYVTCFILFNTFT